MNYYTKDPASNTVSIKDLDLESSIKHFLTAIGEDISRPDIADTPKRFEKAFKYLLNGYDRSFKEENRLFDNKVKFQGLVFFKNIEFFSLCEHHLLPFFGYAHIGYVPSENHYMGISKLARAVDIYAKRLQNQEVLSSQIANALMEHGKAKGVAILIESKHFCTIARGIEKIASVMTTCNFYGSLETNEKLQSQFLELVRDRNKV